MSVDTDGRWVLTAEPCRFCHAPSSAMHPAGVIAGLWKCTRCGHRQNDEWVVIDPRYSIELVGALEENLGDPIDHRNHLEGID